MKPIPNPSPSLASLHTLPKHISTHLPHQSNAPLVSPPIPPHRMLSESNNALAGDSRINSNEYAASTNISPHTAGNGIFVVNADAKHVASPLSPPFKTIGTAAPQKTLQHSPASPPDETPASSHPLSAHLNITPSLLQDPVCAPIISTLRLSPILDQCFTNEDSIVKKMVSIGLAFLIREIYLQGERFEENHSTNMREFRMSLNLSEEQIKQATDLKRVIHEHKSEKLLSGVNLFLKEVLQEWTESTYGKWPRLTHARLESLAMCFGLLLFSHQKNQPSLQVLWTNAVPNYQSTDNRLVAYSKLFEVCFGADTRKQAAAKDDVSSSEDGGSLLDEISSNDELEEDSQEGEDLSTDDEPEELVRTTLETASPFTQKGKERIKLYRERTPQQIVQTGLVCRNGIVCATGRAIGVLFGKVKDSSKQFRPALHISSYRTFVSAFPQLKLRGGKGGYVHFYDLNETLKTYGKPVAVTRQELDKLIEETKKSRSIQDDDNSNRKTHRKRKRSTPKSAEKTGPQKQKKKRRVDRIPKKSTKPVKQKPKSLIDGSSSESSPSSSDNEEMNRPPVKAPENASTTSSTGGLDVDAQIEQLKQEAIQELERHQRHIELIRESIASLVQFKRLQSERDKF